MADVKSRKVRRTDERPPYKIIDVIPVLIGLGFLVLSNGFIISAAIEGDTGMLHWLYIIDIPLILRLRAIWGGVVIDYQNKTITLPGGGISLNNILDVINPKFLLQYFMRKTINIDDVTGIQSSNKVTTNYNRKTGGVSTWRTYYFHINGKFGAIKVSFFSSSKRDECYDEIRQAGRMGTAFIKG